MSTTSRSNLDRLTPQQRWNAKHPEKLKQSSIKQSKDYKRIEIRLHKERDQHLIEWLDTSGSYKQYIYSLIEADYLKHHPDATINLDSNSQ